MSKYDIVAAVQISISSTNSLHAKYTHYYCSYNLLLINHMTLASIFELRKNVSKTNAGSGLNESKLQVAYRISNLVYWVIG